MTLSVPFPATDERPLHALLDAHAAATPDRLAFRHLVDGDSHEETLTCAGLATRARNLAAGLVNRGASGKPVLLLHPPGPGFIEGLFACWHAGAIAVPAYPPRGGRHRRRLEAILGDCGARFALAPEGFSNLANIEVLDGNALESSGGPYDGPAVDFEGPCILQYTSGSTAAPKGVMISHRNLRSHFASLECYRTLGVRSALSWLPPYHDMGLVLKILFAFEAGIPLTTFSPDHFIQRPARWLHAISRYRAEFSGGPNFAFEACIRSIRDEDLEGVDLSCWKAAPCGAERIRPETLERFAKRFASCGFRPEAFQPGYGLAETTLGVTLCPCDGLPPVSRHLRTGPLVSSGAPLPGVALRIADPVTGESLPPRQIGEILVSGSVVSEGYWQRPKATRASFGENGELKTGDLGFLEDGHLFVTGRIKDLIIIDGTNHAPEDIESAVMAAVPEITAAAAFSTDFHGRETVTLALEAPGLPKTERAPLCDRVRRIVADALEVPIRRVCIVRSGLIPRTTSGKIRRAATHAALADGSLKTVHDDQAATSTAAHDPHTLATVLAAVTEITGRAGARADDDVISFGMASLDVARLSALLRTRTGATISPGGIFASRSFASLAAACSEPCANSAGLPETTLSTRANPLTHAQERMWFLHQLDPASAAYHVFGALELTGPLSVRDLARAYQTVVSRHDILRSRHGVDQGKACVWIADNDATDFQSRDLSDRTRLDDELSTFAKAPFRLAEDPPIRAVLFAGTEHRHVLAICAHHIVADGWSMRILIRDLAECYAAFHAATPAPRAPETPSYLDYAARHRQWVDSGAVDSQIDYWKNRLAGHPGSIQLPLDFPRPAKPSSLGDIVLRHLPADLCNRVNALARNHRATPFMVHLAAFFLLLRRHGAGCDPVVAIPVANRNHADAANLIGTLVNTLPFRMTLDPGETFSCLLGRVREASIEMQDNQDAPFERIIEAVNPNRSSDHAPLTQVMFDHQEIPLAEAWPGGLSCRVLPAHRGASQFDLSLLLTAFNDHQQLAIEYRSDLFSPETIAAMVDRHLAVLANICRDPESPVESVSGLTDGDRDFLARVARGPERPHFTHRTALALIAGRVASHPQRKAVDSGGNSLTYQQLATRSDRLATALRHAGLGPGTRAAVCLERDCDLPVALLAIWKTGAAYVPLDPANPPARLRMILEDQAPAHVLASPSLASHLPPDTPTILLEERMMTEAPAGPHPEPSPETPAYVIYTSGSTGRPKGVVVSHAALANFLLSMAGTPGFTEADHLLAVTTVSFDISALELFLPLVIGGSLEILPTSIARDGHALLDSLHAAKPTVMQATPATWRLLLDAGWRGSPHLKILCGGEALDPALATILATKGWQLWNLYGPTETTVWSTCWRVPHNPDRIRIGRPIANTGIHILDDDGAPLPPGVPGNLWISGAGLADGYWRNPDLTSRQFAPVTGEDGGTLRAYKTGDTARWLADGTLECLGRSDGQIKIRGFRVESGDIEDALASHPQVAHAKVALRGATPETARLVAWVTTRPNLTPPDPESLKTYLSTRLPAYMLPAEIGLIDAFPLGSSGKVDPSQLPDPTPECRHRPDTPLTPTERQLAAIWSDLLGRPSILPDDNWFHIGGHSLLALRLFARIHQDLDRRLPLSTILEAPTPRALAARIDRAPTAT